MDVCICVGGCAHGFRAHGGELNLCAAMGTLTWVLLWVP